VEFVTLGNSINHNGTRQLKNSTVSRDPMCPGLPTSWPRHYGCHQSSVNVLQSAMSNVNTWPPERGLAVVLSTSRRDHKTSCRRGQDLSDLSSRLQVRSPGIYDHRQRHLHPTGDFIALS